jgi:hypothetical protein
MRFIRFGMGCYEKLRNKVLVKKELPNNLIDVVFSGHSFFRSDQWQSQAQNRPDGITLQSHTV